MHVSDFARLLGNLPAVCPVSGRLRSESGKHLDHFAYPHERAHMVDWFQSQISRGGGAYTRSAPNTSARRTYNRVLNPISLLWIAEALGEDEAVVHAAAAAVVAESEYRRRPALVRRHIPWVRVFELATIESQR